MAISQISTANIGLTSVTDIAITHGLTIQSGDVLVAFLHSDANTTQTDNNGSTPFTSPYSIGTPGNVSKAYIWARVCGSSEPSTYHWTLDGTQNAAVILRQFRGVDATIWDVAPAAGNTSTGTSASPSAPSITIANAGAASLFAVFADQSNSSFISGVTNSYANEVKNELYRNVASYTRTGLSTGELGSTGATLAVSDDWAAFQFSLKPAVELPTVTGLSVSSGAAGSTVVITGTNFSGVTSVHFGAANVSSYTVDSTTQITATVPDWAG